MFSPYHQGQQVSLFAPPDRLRAQRIALVSQFVRIKENIWVLLVSTQFENVCTANTIYLFRCSENLNQLGLGASLLSEVFGLLTEIEIDLS